ncbi:MAG: tetratricopeptide repeat protein [Verrucomicrobia bacterium]|nr:tetratricopeptide repeat protein [Verrucomicrobiota bacterium]
MTTRNTIQLAVFLLILLTSPAQAAESLSVLLQKGIFAEETEGNLDAAIKIYEGIVKEGESNRALVAQAQYRLGVCRLKQGKAEEAAAAFRKLIEQYADAAELVAKSRERLAAIGQPAAAVTMRQVWPKIGDLQPSRLSPDGQVISFIDWETGDLWLRDLRSTANRKLTQSAGWTNSSEHVIDSVFSPDGKQIAYDWYNKTNDSYEIRLLTLKDPKPQVLAAPTNCSLFVGDWSPDGKTIAVSNWERERRDTNQWKHSISLISISDGSERPLVSMATSNNISTLRFSPDGSYLAYNFQRNQRSEPRTLLTNDLFVVDVRKGTQTRVVEHLAHEQFVGWAPHGSAILFSSERRETVDLWSLQIENGEAKGNPKLLKADLGIMDPIGLSREGSLFYATAVQDAKYVYVGTVDFESGKVIAEPKPIKTMFEPPGMASNKAVGSADRKFLFFCAGNKEPTAYILNLESGEQHAIPKSDAWGSRIRWWWPSTDSTFLFVSLFGPVNKGGWYRVNVHTGEMVPLALHKEGIRQMIDNPIRFCIYDGFLGYGRLYENPKKLVLVKHDLQSNRETEYEIPGLDSSPIPRMPNSYPNRAILLADGRSFFFNRWKASENLHALIRHDLATGIQKEFVTSKSPIGVVDTASEETVFITTTDERQRPVFTLFSISDSELSPRFQATVPDGFEYRGQHWSEPHLILIKTAGQEKGALAEMWTLSVRSGELKRLGLSVPDDQRWGLRKNSQLVQFQMTTSGSRDVWVMENFLPPKAYTE